MTVGFPAKIRHCANVIFGYYQFGKDSEPIEKPKYGNSSNFHSFPELNRIFKDDYLKSDDGDKAAVKYFIKNRSAEFFADGTNKICCWTNKNVSMLTTIILKTTYVQLVANKLYFYLFSSLASFWYLYSFSWRSVIVLFIILYFIFCFCFISIIVFVLEIQAIVH